MIWILWEVIKLVLVAIVIFSWLHVSVSHFIAYIELRLERMKRFFLPEEDQLPSASVFVKSYLLEVFAMVMAVLCSPLMFLPFRPKTSGGQPILLLHGYMHNHTGWTWIRRKLEKEGHGPIYSMNLLPPFASIPHLSEKVAKKVSSIIEETDSENIILIGHSMGGLVASFYTEYLADKDQISKVITLGSPFHGTRLAALGHGHNVAEMVPNSGFLAELRQRVIDSSVSYHLIASKLDNIVVPWKSALIKEDDIKQLTLDHCGHNSLLISPAVTQQISAWLDDLPDEESEEEDTEAPDIEKFEATE